MIEIETGGNYNSIVFDENAKYAVILQQPDGLFTDSPTIMRFITPLVNNLNGIYPIIPDKVNGIAQLNKLRYGWHRVQSELKYFGKQVKRILLMCDTKTLRVCIPGLGKHGDMSACHGTIFTLKSGIELVPTWLVDMQDLHHIKPWQDRDLQRFLKLTKPNKPLEFQKGIPNWLT